jgi:hypothetical protein
MNSGTFHFGPNRNGERAREREGPQLIISPYLDAEKLGRITISISSKAKHAPVSQQARES